MIAPVIRTPPGLLVSVFAAGEIEAALAGGASVVDVKGPGAGLAPAALETIRAVVDAVAGRARVSAVVEDAESARACGADDVKLGLSQRRGAEERLRAVVAAVPRARVVAVAFADAEGDESLRPTDLPRIARACGAQVAMLDTARKDGRTTFDVLGEEEIAAFVRGAQALGLAAAVSGALGPSEVERAASLGADIVGVRTSACDGGRGGRVHAERVRGLCAALSRGRAASEASPVR
jgi:uncharacterized protein (UPF0264 family)